MATPTLSIVNEVKVNYNKNVFKNFFRSSNTQNFSITFTKQCDFCGKGYRKPACLPTRSWGCHIKLQRVWKNYLPLPFSSRVVSVMLVPFTSHAEVIFHYYLCV
jgi:hypothetical protein